MDGKLRRAAAAAAVQAAGTRACWDNWPCSHRGCQTAAPRRRTLADFSPGFLFYIYVFSSKFTQWFLLLSAWEYSVCRRLQVGAPTISCLWSVGWWMEECTCSCWGEGSFMEQKEKKRKEGSSLLRLFCFFFYSNNTIFFSLKHQGSSRLEILKLFSLENTAL